ncbi:MAG: 4-alpha-glucanotransferase [Lachnospiraceae bacterium]|nr:4-alpha-glucanotransferase [Lachnospiraceae bacterium]
MRSVGILLPVFSLPSEYGIGSFGKEAYEFIDFCNESGIGAWQMLPLGPTGYGDSPYQSFSAFAWNPYYVDIEELVKEGLLKDSEVAAHKVPVNQVDYLALYNTRFSLLHKAFHRFDKNKNTEYSAFVRENAFWLKDYALYMAIKDAHHGKCFTTWEKDLKFRKPMALTKAKRLYKKEIEFYMFVQFYAGKQWNQIHNYARSRGVKLIGDIPFYVAYDSADVWCNPGYFQLDENLDMVSVAGCPPDAFSEDGQLWGNPLYRWEVHREERYNWWITRIRQNLMVYDKLRIDHFRGFESYYSIPGEDDTAKNGHWVKGPGAEFFDVVNEAIVHPDIIAEDLGILGPKVRELLDYTEYPGMKVLQFAFNHLEESAYLPKNHVKHCVVYTGTHDNDTLKGWYESLSDEDLEYLCSVLGKKVTYESVAYDMIELAMASVADMVIIPMADFLALPSSARINQPSTLGENWKWRMDKNALSDELSGCIKNLLATYER